MKPLQKVALQGLLTPLFILILTIMGCQSDAPNSPSTDVKIKRSTNQLQFLKPKEIRFNKGIESKQFILAAQGGTISVGSKETGYSNINFMSGDLNDDAMITFRWDSQNYLADFSPHGIDFNNPVRLNLSYEDADLSNVNEGEIQIWYFNETENVWELIGGEVNVAEKRVEGFINHFSRYALAEDE